MKNPRFSSFFALAASLCLAQSAVAQDEDFYDTSVLRTIELTFEQSNYWQQLENNYAQTISKQSADLQKPRAQ